MLLSNVDTEDLGRAFAEGYRAGLEAAAKACEALDQFDMYATSACAEEIRALAADGEPK